MDFEDHWCAEEKISTARMNGQQSDGAGTCPESSRGLHRDGRGRMKERPVSVPGPRRGNTRQTEDSIIIGRAKDASIDIREVALLDFSMESQEKLAPVLARNNLYPQRLSQRLEVIAVARPSRSLFSNAILALLQRHSRSPSFALPSCRLWLLAVALFPFEFCTH